MAKRLRVSARARGVSAHPDVGLPRDARAALIEVKEEAEFDPWAIAAAQKSLDLLALVVRASSVTKTPMRECPSNGTEGGSDAKAHG